jgi:hypothetical protein
MSHCSFEGIAKSVLMRVVQTEVSTWPEVEEDQSYAVGIVKMKTIEWRAVAAVKADLKIVTVSYGSMSPQSHRV